MGLRGVAEDGDEEQEESTCKLIVHWARVHGPVALQEGSAQDTHVLPLQQQKGEGKRSVKGTDLKIQHYYLLFISKQIKCLSN